MGPKPAGPQTEQAVVQLDGREYPLILKTHPRARHIKLRTDAPNGAIILTMPPMARKRDGIAFVTAQKKWIQSSFAKAGTRRVIQDGGTIAFRGVQTSIRWDADHSRMVRHLDGVIMVGGPRDLIGQRTLRWLKAEARKCISAEARFYSARAGEAPVKTRLSSATRRWGSCSADRNIRINWRLIMAPDAVRQSVIAHEIAHLRHMNHSPAFYQWLDQIFDGDRHQADAWLKAHGRALYMVCCD